MAHTIKLGSFAKKENSTAQPNTTSWAEYNVTLKNGADLSNPTLELTMPWYEAVNYNYAYFMSKYYYIVGKNLIRENLCVFDLKIDVLATYKTQIGNSSLYVLRSASTYNGNIVDRLYPTTSITYGHAEDDAFLPGSYARGNYIVNIVGKSTTANSTLWKLTPVQFTKLLYNLYTNINGFQFTDIRDAVKKFLDGSPEKLVSSAMWMPPYNFASTPFTSLSIGTWDLDFGSADTVERIDNPIFNLSVIELTLPKHPQAATRGAYLNLAPYTTYTLTIPMFGTINIDTTAVKDASSIYINITVDALSGQGKCRVHSGGNPRPIIADLTAQVGVPIPLQGQNAGASIAGGIATTLGSVAVAIASGGAAIPVIGAAAAGIDTAITAMSGASFSTGSAGGALATTQNITLDATFLNVAAADNIRRGRPLCEVRQINTLPGYNIVADGDLTLAIPLPENQEIKQFLESGFFYE